MSKKNDLVLYVIKENKKLRKRIQNLENLLAEKSNFKEVLSVSETCELFGMSTKTFHRYVKMGLKVKQAKPNAKIYVLKSNVESFLKFKNYGR